MNERLSARDFYNELTMAEMATIYQFIDFMVDGIFAILTDFVGQERIIAGPYPDTMDADDYREFIWRVADYIAYQP